MGSGEEELTQHGGLVDVKAADADGGVSVRVVAVDDHLPVVDALGEADATQHHPVVEAAACHAEVVVGEYHVRGSRGGVEREPGHCNEKKHCNWSVVVVVVVVIQSYPTLCTVYTTATMIAEEMARLRLLVKSTPW